MAIINGTEMDDVLKGTQGFETINGFAGNDTIYGKGGNDLIRGHQGDDVIIAGTSGLPVGHPDSRLYGGYGQDVIVGGEGPDRIDGGYGADRLFGGVGSDGFTWRSGDGDDVIVGGGTADASSGIDTVFFALAPTSARVSFSVHEEDVADVFVSDAAGDTHLSITEVERFVVQGSEGKDTVNFLGYTGRDVHGVIQTGGGDDRVFATNLDDEVWDGTGNDFVSLRGGNDTWAPQEGNDRIYTGWGQDRITITDGAIQDGRWAVIDFNTTRDRLEVLSPNPDKVEAGYLDTNGDGYLGEGDRNVGVTDGAMTLDLGGFAKLGTQGPSVLVLEGVTKLDMANVDLFFIGH